MKPVTVLLLMLLVATNALWLYRALDHAMAEGRQRQDRYEGANRLIAAATLAAEAVRGKPKADVETLLHKVFPTEQQFERDGALQTPWISLPLNPDGSVAGVAIDPGTREAAAHGAAVDIEVFYPPVSSSSPQR